MKVEQRNNIPFVSLPRGKQITVAEWYMPLFHMKAGEGTRVCPQSENIMYCMWCFETGLAGWVVEVHGETHGSFVNFFQILGWCVEGVIKWRKVFRKRTPSWSTVQDGTGVRFVAHAERIVIALCRTTVRLSHYLNVIHVAHIYSSVRFPLLRLVCCNRQRKCQVFSMCRVCSSFCNGMCFFFCPCPFLALFIVRWFVRWFLLFYQIAGRYISGLVALINEHIESLDPSDARSEMQRYFSNTLDHIRRKKSQADLPEGLREKFAAVAI